MKDMFGTVLKNGDTVVIPAPRYRHLVKAPVIRLTAFKAQVMYTNTWNYKDGRPETFRASRDQLVKVPETAAAPPAVAE